MNLINFKIMSPKLNHNVAPEGWRELSHGEMVIEGDIFNINSGHPEEEAKWMPYKTLVGQAYESSMFSIRRLN